MIRLNIFGSEVDYTNPLILLVKNMLCSKFHRDQGEAERDERFGQPDLVLAICVLFVDGAGFRTGRQLGG